MWGRGDTDAGGKAPDLLTVVEEFKVHGAQIDNNVVVVDGQAEITGRHPGNRLVGALGQSNLVPA